MDKEQFYDEKISFKLSSIAKECGEKEISFISICEWSPGEFASISKLQAKSGLPVQMIKAVIESNGNIDAFLTAVIKHAKIHGHSSMYLHQLGIPTAPMNSIS
jgi:hypothetical protein